MISGVLLIDKPAGLTSHDVVARVRRVSQQRKVGHTGTLDPFATGLLLVALGGATKNIKYTHDWPKGYEATVTLGATSTTDDPEGELTKQPGIKAPAQETVVAALSSFLGEQRQVPPIFSAKKIRGERAYKIARRNKGRGDPTSPSGLRGARSLIMPPHVITIHELELLRYSYPEVNIRVSCSTGTYIRALARDLGRSLSTGAYCSSLRRTAIGPHSVNQATPLAVLEKAKDVEKFILPADAMLP